MSETNGTIERLTVKDIAQIQKDTLLLLNRQDDHLRELEDRRAG